MLTPVERRLRAQIAANARWARGGRVEHGQKIRAAKLAHYEREVDPNDRLDPAERRKRAENALSRDMQRLSFKAARARSRGL